MTENILCNLCSCPGRLDQATEVMSVPSNIRQFQQERFTVWRCVNCGSLHSQEDVDLDRYYAGYFLHEQKLDYFSKRIFGNYLRYLRKHGLRRKHSILDYGCGNGMSVALFQRKGYLNAVGYDPYVKEFSDPRALERGYDVIQCCEVIEHVDEPRQLLEKLASHLNPGGLLAISAPNASYIDLQDHERCLAALHQPYHRHIPAEKALLQLGRELSLEAVCLTRRNLDTVYPAVNARFIYEYIRAAGNVGDVVVEPARVGMVLASPRLLFFAAFGAFFPVKWTMLVIFRKPGFPR